MNQTDYIECTECHNIVPITEGTDHKEGFICKVCIQNDFYARLEEFENDPKHKNIPIDDLFTDHDVVIRRLAYILLGILITIIILLLNLMGEENYEKANTIINYNRIENPTTQKNLN